MTDARPATPARRLRLILALVGVAVAVLALALYAARKVIAREALVSWLHAKGIAADAQVESFGPSGFTGRLRIGDAKRPDFTAARAEVGYGFRGFGLDVRSVTLRQPVLRARLHDGKLSLGSLDPLIEEFRRKPPRPDATKPSIRIDQGLLLLTTDYGPMQLRADARVRDDKLMSLDAAAAPARLRGPGFDASLGASAVTLRTHGDRVAITLDAPLAQATAGPVSAEAGRLRLTAAAPYPDLQHRRGDGAVVAQANLTGRRIALAGQGVEDAQLAAAFTGQATGWIPDLTVRGRAVADLRAASAALAGGRAGTLRAALTADDLSWTRKGGDAVSGVLKLAGGADSYALAELRLQGVTAAAQGPFSASAKRVSLRLTGSALGHGAWMGLGAPTAGDSTEIAAAKRAARGFRFAAPGVTLASDGGAARMALAQPVRLSPDRGGAVTLAQRGSGYRLTAAGGGLPKVEADVDQFALVPGGATADGRIRAALSIGPIQHGVFDASGTLRIADGAVSFTGDRCASVRAERLELGVNDVAHLAGQLCPEGRPLLTLGHGDWRIVGRARGVSAEVPFLQATVTGGSGAADLGQTGGRLNATLTVASAQVEDIAPASRFRPLTMSGKAALARDQWIAGLDVRDIGGRPVGHAELRHDGRAGVGRVDLDSGVLTFAEGGLQPAQLSPLAAALGSPVQGSARFVGAFAWTPAGATSGGTLSLPGLDFQSPAGRMTGLAGTVVFTSLAPLTVAPGGVLRADALAAILPLTGLSATFGLDAHALHVSGGEAAVGGGKVRLASLDVPLQPGAPTRGVLDVEGVELHDLVAASPFKDRVSLDARVSGRVPFETQGGKVQVSGGELHAIQPGRLSIQRTALSAVSASGAIEAPKAAPAPVASTDTFTDFAYQAMENLAFDKLDATLDSRPGGQLGVLFHVVGRHDPPQRQELAVTWLDLIRRNFMNRKLPLPSGTEVDLTLDTSLNLDDLLKDYADYQKLRSSRPVQP
ncbi:C4-dicarboxylate ABC transporter [Phenylobacterium hankyongense]|uniref:C4-dicarboxylate ABC transporter n=1 Tax=Phenylobacterium hankyongense TaxID=1813876 RepID=A0A328AZM1_9CAUL|nr:YdbH domain-containing protein [Phenylobacterium hankyongense]RAK59126.1 C4-dicarboxylate ABC transporter [Phenylobacterium hankyongense]